jgi:hypothetical protein
MNLDNLFMISNEKRLRTYFGYPTVNTCAKPIQGRQMPIFEYESDAERFSQCSCSCPVDYSRCKRNYYSPFE